MSAEYYLKQGYTPLAKVTVISGLNTISVWNPAAGKRVVLTGMNIASNVASTIAFYFEGDAKFMQFYLSSSIITPTISAIESTMVNGNIFAKLGTASATEGCIVNLQGFELD